MSEKETAPLIPSLPPAPLSVWAHQWLCGWRFGRHLSVGRVTVGTGRGDIEEACKARAVWAPTAGTLCCGSATVAVTWYCCTLMPQRTEGVCTGAKVKEKAKQKRARTPFSACAFVLCLVCRALPVSFNTGSLCFRTHTPWALFSDINHSSIWVLVTLRFLWAL